jgi:hypothetical protein
MKVRPPVHLVGDDRLRPERRQHHEIEDLEAFLRRRRQLAEADHPDPDPEPEDPQPPAA